MEVTQNTEQKTELIKQTEIKNSPFTIVKVEDKYFLAMGRFRLTEALDTEEEVKKASKMTWDRVMQIMHIMIEVNEKQKAEIEKLTKN